MSRSTVLILCIILYASVIANVDSMLCYDAYTIIKHPLNGFVLEASGQKLQLRNYTRTPGQLWKLRHRCDGTYYIFNAHIGCGLDIQGGEVAGNEVITSCIRSNMTHYWYINSDGSIVNAGPLKLAIDVPANDRIIAATKDGSDSQKFELSCLCCPYCPWFRSSCC